MQKASVKILTKYWDQIDPLSLESYRKKGGYEALKKALRDLDPDKVISTVKEAGLQGRGGGGFLTGSKWEIARAVKSNMKYLICNLDESEPGTYKDRMLAEKNPHQLLEGLAIAAYAVGAKKAFIYLNGNFHTAQKILEQALNQAYRKNFIGRSVMGFAFDLEVELFVGAGAYVCGEESALINSIEGKRGEPRSKPPYPCDCGLFGKPTVVNNAETLSNIPWIIKNGANEFSRIGLKDSAGTKLFSVGGSVKRPGIYELPIGTSIKELIFDYAEGMEEGKRIWFVQMGGSSGKLVMSGRIDEAPSFSVKSAIPMGSGALVVVDTGQDLKKILLSWINFFQRESCGKCVPCREGTFRLKQILERLANGEFDANDKQDIKKLVWTLDNTTFCPLGKFSVVALKDVIKYRLVEELL